MKYNWRLLLACGLVLGVAGCESPPPPHVVTMTGDPVTDGEAMLAITPEKDKLLPQCETAAIAMDRGRFPEAKQLLDEADRKAPLVRPWRGEILPQVRDDKSKPETEKK